MTVESQNLIWRPVAMSDGAAMADLLNAIDAEVVSRNYAEAGKSRQTTGD